MATTGLTAAQARPRLFTIDELEEMVRRGIVRENERVELIEGQIVERNPMGTGHIWTVSRLCGLFGRQHDVVITPQSTLELPDGSGPEPGLTVLHAETPQSHRPTAADALLVIEVADSTLAYDRNTKAPLYAKAGIPEYWIVDLNGGRIEVYREPSPAGYRATRIVLRGERITPLFAPDFSIDVDAVLGPSESPGVSPQSPEVPSPSDN